MLKTKRKHAKKNYFHFVGTKRFAPTSRLRKLGAGSACRGALTDRFRWGEKKASEEKLLPFRGTYEPTARIGCRLSLPRGTGG